MTATQYTLVALDLVASLVLTLVLFQAVQSVYIDFRYKFSDRWISLGVLVAVAYSLVRLVTGLMAPLS